MHRFFLKWLLLNSHAFSIVFFLFHGQVYTKSIFFYKNTRTCHAHESQTGLLEVWYIYFLAPNLNKTGVHYQLTSHCQGQSYIIMYLSTSGTCVRIFLFWRKVNATMDLTSFITQFQKIIKLNTSSTRYFDALVVPVHVRSSSHRNRSILLWCFLEGKCFWLNVRLSVACRRIIRTGNKLGMLPTSIIERAHLFLLAMCHGLALRQH